MRSSLVSKIAGCSLLVVFAATPLFAEDRNTLPKKQHRRSDAPFLSPSQAVEKMAIPEGFDVTVFASEPDIAEPIAFCFDGRGRLWVVENFNYVNRGAHTDDPVSRIQILEDVDGDGQFDKKKTFTDTLTFTSGIACGFGGVFLGSPPNLTFIPDADGDDVPDGPPEVLLDGWGMNDRHETLNSFIWGPDGWLYGCHGVFTHSKVGKPGTPDAQRQFIDAGIWRYHPTQDKFEIFARGLSNPWGFDFDEHGQGFATCCVIPHLFHVVQGGVYHKQSRPHVNPYIYDDIKTIRDHTHLSAHGGARFYLADAFPEEYRGRLFMCNIHEHAVLTDVMVPNGSSFIGKHGDDFLPANDMAWVGFSVEIGPDGGVYILDWHDQDICGNAIEFPNSGRVYKIMPSVVERVSAPNITGASDLDLVAFQLHSNDWYARNARLELQYRASRGVLNREQVLAELDRLFATTSSAANKLRVLWCQHAIGGLDVEQLTGLLAHGEPYVRAWAIQLLTDGSGVNVFQPQADQTLPLSPEVLARFESLATEDSSPIVRQYLASAAQRIPMQNRWEILTRLVQHAEDIDDPNVPRMIWFALEPMVPEFPEQALRLASQSKMPAIQEFVARRITSGSEPNLDFKRMQRDVTWNSTIQKFAPGFRVADVGEGGVVAHAEFRNAAAVQTHPKDRDTPSRLSRWKMYVPKEKRTRLHLRVSHHPHGDWLLKVRVGQETLLEQVVGSKTVGDDEWLDVEVDLSRFAGELIHLRVENHANDWKNEWAYWNRVEVISE